MSEAFQGIGNNKVGEKKYQSSISFIIHQYFQGSQIDFLKVVMGRGSSVFSINFFLIKARFWKRESVLHTGIGSLC